MSQRTDITFSLLHQIIPNRCFSTPPNQLYAGDYMLLCVYYSLTKRQKGAFCTHETMRASVPFMAHI